MKKSVIKIEKAIVALHERLERIRSRCPHKHVNKEYHSDTGNYNRNDNQYWTNFECLDCGYRWNEEGSK